jgi:hypothetical protein
MVSAFPYYCVCCPKNITSGHTVICCACMQLLQDTWATSTCTMCPGHQLLTGTQQGCSHTLYHEICFLVFVRQIVSFKINASVPESLLQARSQKAIIFSTYESTARTKTMNTYKTQSAQGISRQPLSKQNPHLEVEQHLSLLLHPAGCHQ